MKTIAHRGGMNRTMQNSPSGVRMAVHHGADFVELDIVQNSGGAFVCAHGGHPQTPLHACLIEIPAGMELLAHLKGGYTTADLRRLLDVISQHMPRTRVIFASHRGGILLLLSGLDPEIRLARFGLLPAITLLLRPRPWRYCLVNQSVLVRPLVQWLQQRGYRVFASCVWEWRSRQSVARLGVDGAFLNLYTR